MKRKVWALFLIFVFMILAGCTALPNFFERPTPTPPEGFLLMDSFVPSNFLSQPSFSRDGNLLAVGGAYHPESSEIDNLLVIDIETKQILFSSPEGLYYWISLAPEGNMLATTEGDSGVVIDLETNAPTHIIPGFYPVWSPDGQQLASGYSTGPADQSRHIQIRLYDFITRQETIVSDTPSVFGWIQDLAWSSDGKMIAFTMVKEGPADGKAWPDLYVLNMDDGSVVRLSASMDVISPNFSSDGKKILFWGAPSPIKIDSVYSLYVVDLEGNCRQLDKLPIERFWSVVLSPDKSRIAFPTYYGVLMAETEFALGSDFWSAGEPCSIN